MCVHILRRSFEFCKFIFCQNFLNLHMSTNIDFLGRSPLKELNYFILEINCVYIYIYIYIYTHTHTYIYKLFPVSHSVQTSSSHQLRWFHIKGNFLVIFPCFLCIKLQQFMCDHKYLLLSPSYNILGGKCSLPLNFFLASVSWRNIFYWLQYWLDFLFLTNANYWYIFEVNDHLFFHDRHQKGWPTFQE